MCTMTKQVRIFQFYANYSKTISLSSELSRYFLIDRVREKSGMMADSYGISMALDVIQSENCRNYEDD